MKRRPPGGLTSTLHIFPDSTRPKGLIIWSCGFARYFSGRSNN